MRVWWSRWRDVSKCRKVMRIHFMHSGHLKIILNEVAEVLIQVSKWNWKLLIFLWRCRNDMRTHFLHSGHLKKPLWRIRGSDVLIRGMALKTHYLLSECLKMRICWFRRSDV
jgi:hypothetical protein